MGFAAVSGGLGGNSGSPGGILGPMMDLWDPSLRPLRLTAAAVPQFPSTSPHSKELQAGELWDFETFSIIPGHVGGTSLKIWDDPISWYSKEQMEGREIP